MAQEGQKQSLEEPLDRAGGSTGAPLIWLHLGVGLEKRQGCPVVTGRSPFDERPAERLEVAKYIGLAVPGETGPPSSS